MSDRSGRCGCGSVTFSVVGPIRDVLHCHCENCRRITGNFTAASAVDVGRLSIDDPDRRLTWFDLGYARYGSCERCGSTMFWRASDGPDQMSIMVGTLDDADDLVVAAVWFADEAQAHHHLPDAVPRFAGNGSETAGPGDPESDDGASDGTGRAPIGRELGRE